MSPTTPTPDAQRRRDPERSRQNLLEAAEALFVERGFDGCRIDEVAARAGINKRMIYAYFGNKEELYGAVLRRSFERALSDGLRLPPEPSEPRARTEALLRRYFGYLAAHPGFVRLLSWETLQSGQRSSAVLRELAEQELSKLGAVVAQGQAQGVFRQDLDLRHMVLAVHGMFLAFFSRKALLEQLWGEDLAQPGTQERVLDDLLHLVFEGISPPAARAAQR